METHKFTWLLIIANVAVFLFVFSMPEAMKEAVFQLLAFSWGTKFEIWRWFTSMFMHASASHLFFNMIGLYFFGKILEHEVGPQWFLSIYFIGGILGTFVFMFTSPSFVVGASGAMFAVLGAAMLMNPLKRIHLYLFPLPLGIIAIAYLIFETVVVHNQPSEYANVANIAHLAGMFTGALFAFFYNPKRSIEGIVVLIVCAVLILFLGTFFAVVAGIGGIFLSVLDWIVGLVLYNIAGIIGLIWV